MQTRTTDDFSLEDFDRTFAVNVRAVFVAIQEACRFMGQGGRIINIASGAAERMPWPGVGAYTMTKAAIADLHAILARVVLRSTMFSPALRIQMEIQRTDLTRKGQEN
jgi:NAD(P)-dependent dehydrogenase (short-subunit alcohol dehydrogenase family)